MTEDTLDNHQPLESYPDSVDQKREFALRLGAFLQYLGTGDTVVLDIAAQSSVSEYFVIATVTSQTHLKGTVRQLDEWMLPAGVRPRSRHRSHEEGGWVLLDCEFVVVHLMTQEVREFYELEKLWFESIRVYPHTR